MSRRKDLYEILGVSKTATEQEIKKVYRELARQHHPDKGGNEQKFKEIKAAYEVLTNPQSRYIYDMHGEEGLRTSNIPTNIFDILFGEQGTFFNLFRNMNMHTTARSQETGSFPKVSPVSYIRKVSLEDICSRRIISLTIERDRTCSCNLNRDLRCPACNGTGKRANNIHIQNPFGFFLNQCLLCKGKGVRIASCDNCIQGVIKDQKVFNIHLTPDCYQGQQYIFSGEGNEYPGYLAGDFIVVISILPHKQFELSNNDFIYRHKILLKDALCGSSHLIIHPSGEKLLIETEYINPTKDVIKYGKGKNDSGNLIIKHEIIYPDSLTDKQRRELYHIL